MDFDLPRELEELRGRVREFAERRVAPVAQRLDENEEFSVGLCREMGELGLFGIQLPARYGGGEKGQLGYVIAVEELARVDASQAATVAANDSLGAGSIYGFGSEEQKRRYLPRLCSGEALWAFGLTETSGGSDAGATQTTAVPEGDGWRINGSKTFITNASAPISLGVTVQAVTGTRPDGRREYSCFLVETGTPGYEAVPMRGKMMWRASDTARLSLRDVRLPGDALLGRRGEGFRQMLEILDHGRLSIGAMGLGAAQGAYELALLRARSRQAFGQPISRFQGIAFRLADMRVQIEAARGLLYRAAWLCDQGREFALEAAMAKLYCSEAAHLCVDGAVQIYGGYGLLKSNPVERLYRDQRILEIGEGTSEVLRLVIARRIGCYRDGEEEKHE